MVFHFLRERKFAFLCWLLPLDTLLLQSSASNPSKALKPAKACARELGTGKKSRAVDVGGGHTYTFDAMFENSRFQRVSVFRECADEQRLVLMFRPTASFKQSLDFYKVVCDAYPQQQFMIPGTGTSVVGTVHPLLKKMCLEFIKSSAFAYVMKTILAENPTVILSGFSMGASFAIVMAAVLAQTLRSLDRTNFRIILLFNAGFPAGDPVFVDSIHNDPNIAAFSGYYNGDRIPRMFNGCYGMPAASNVFTLNASEVPQRDRVPVPRCTWREKLKIFSHIKFFLTDRHLMWPSPQFPSGTTMIQATKQMFDNQRDINAWLKTLFPPESLPIPVPVLTPPPPAPAPAPAPAPPRPAMRKRQPPAPPPPRPPRRKRQLSPPVIRRSTKLSRTLPKRQPRQHPTTTEAVSYSKSRVAAMRIEAKARDLTGTSKLRKAELYALLYGKRS